MAEYQIVTLDTHYGEKWSRADGFHFAADETSAVIGFAEIAKAMLHLPLAFSKEDDSYYPVVLQGLMMQQNLLVRANGSWALPFIPAVYLHYPFRLGRNTQDDKYYLCIDSKCVTRGDKSNAYDFYNAQGEVAKELEAVFKSLVAAEKDKIQGVGLATRMNELELLESWPLKIKNGEEVQEVTGLYRINETKLNNLDPQRLAELMHSGGLRVAYSQILSMQNIVKLGELARNQLLAETREKENSESGDLAFGNYGNISFENI